MKTQTITPLGKKVLLKEKKPSPYFPGTTILRPEVNQEKTYQGYVVAVGEDVENVNVGDLVQYADYAIPTEMMHDGETHLLLPAGELLAKLNE